MIRLLHLEDDPSDAALIEDQLRRKWPDCAIEHVDNAADYVEAITSDRPFHVILADYSIPGYDGMEALAQAKSDRRETPFIFVSGAIGEHRAIETIADGATDYVLKDTLQRLVPVLSRALEEAEQKRKRQHAEAELRELAETLEHRVEERTAELETFAHSVSHDLRAPLRGMYGFADALLEDYGVHLDETGQFYCKRIINAASRMQRLIEDLLTYSHLSRDEINLRQVPLDKVVKESLQQIENDENFQAAEIQVAWEMPAVRAHLPTLILAVQNLLSNAIKFVEPGTTPQVNVWAEWRGRRVRLFVEDNGLGIEKKHHLQIFNVFERLHSDEKFPGTGIGLALVRKSLDRVGGAVGVDSKVGQGSRFWLELEGADE